MSWDMLVSVALPVALSLILTPAVIVFAKHVGAIDQPNERKIHARPMPRLGGVAIYLSFFLALLLLDHIAPSASPFRLFGWWKSLMFISALVIVHFLGIADDCWNLSAPRKFVVQVVAASIMYAGGFRISIVTDLLGIGSLTLGPLDLPVTILWIVGVTNAFNLIDGLDGLASGVGVIAALTIAAVAFLNADVASVTMALCLVGALTGFLWYNFNPARIFLGDSGSLFIGFLLAVLSIQSSTKGSTAFAMMVPVLALGLPIMDTLVAMMRRFLSSLLPEESRPSSLVGKFSRMFLPDRRHIHHQLVALGISHRRVVLLLYLISCLFGIGAFAVTSTNNVGASLVLLCVAVASVSGIRQLRYREMAILRNGLFLPMYDLPLMNRSFFLGFLDLAFIGLSFVAATAILPPPEVTGQVYPGFRIMLPIVCGLKLTFFYAFGMHKGTFRLVGIGDLVHIFRAVLLSSIISAVLLSLFPATQDFVSARLLILDTYFLMTLVVLTRTSFPILNYFFRRSQEGEQHALIYGAAANGMILLQQILNNPSMKLTPIGFLDDRQALQGKLVNGYPVFGGHWTVPALLKRHKIDQILIASDTVKYENLHRLQEIASEHGILLKRPRLQMEDLPAQKSPRKRLYKNEEPRLEVAVSER